MPLADDKKMQSVRAKSVRATECQGHILYYHIYNFLRFIALLSFKTRMP